MRIEKTLEVSDVDEEDKTLSLTKDDDIFDNTDNEEDIELDTTTRPRLMISNVDRSFKRKPFRETLFVLKFMFRIIV